MLTARNAEDGEATEEVDASYTGESLVVAFNPEYLMDGLEVAGSDEVVLQTRDPQKPAVLRPVGSQDFLYLLMPVRVS
jgi:DNA polymerase-3 subunit beta